MSFNFDKDPLKIISITGTPNKRNIRVNYQISGKSAILFDDPEELIRALGIVKGFSKEDSLLIFKLFITQLRTPSIKIKNITFYENNEEYQIEDLENNANIVITSSSIFESEDLINRFSSMDLLMVFSHIIDRKNRKEKIQLRKFKTTPKRNLYVIENQKSD